MPIAARNESGAERNRGNERMRSTRSSGISGIVEAVSGEGRTGRVGLVSMLKDRIKDRESGIGAPFPRKGELPPPLPRRIVCLMYSCQPLFPPMLISMFHGLSAVVPLGLPDVRPGLRSDRL